MISFALSEEQSIARSVAREFATNVLRPLASKVDDDGAIPREVLDRLWSLGVVQARAVAEEAPADADVLDAVVLEELGWGDAVFALAIASPLAFIRAIARHGSAQQKASLLPLFQGDNYQGAAVLMAEPGFLKGARSASAVAVRDRDGYQITGVKLQAPLTETCSHFLVVAKCDGKLDAFIVAAATPGVKISRPEGNLGLAALGLASVEFDGARIGADMRLGGDNGCDVQRLVDASRTAASAVLTGICRSVYDHISVYTKERHAHGSALARKQTVAFRIVDMYVETEAMRWMTWRAATHLSRPELSTRSAALAHMYAADQAAWITDEGVQLMGGHGFMRANPVERWYRNAKTLSLFDGAASA